MNKQRVTREGRVKDKYVSRWERPRSCGPAASADAALVAPTSAHCVSRKYLDWIPN